MVFDEKNVMYLATVYSTNVMYTVKSRSRNLWKPEPEA